MNDKNYTINDSSLAKKKSLDKKWYVLLFVVLILAVVVFVILANQSGNDSNMPGTASKSRPQPVTAKTGSTEVSTTQDKQSSGSVATTGTPVANTNVTLIKPSGAFVSNHKPGQNGSPLEEASVCNTSPSASCVINFTKDGVVRSLPSKVTDNSGAAYWTWTPKSVGLSAGNWVVTATSTLGQQSATTQDPVILEVIQ